MNGDDTHPPTIAYIDGGGVLGTAVRPVLAPPDDAPPTPPVEPDDDEPLDDEPEDEPDDDPELERGAELPDGLDEPPDWPRV